MKEKILHFGSYLLVAMLATVMTLTFVHLEIGLRPSKLDQLEQLIDEKFIGEALPEELEDAAAYAMVKATGDRWSYYIPASEYEAYREQAENAYVGVGMTIQATEDGSGFLIVDVVPEGPAQEAGIRIQDLLIRVEDTDIRSLTAAEVRDLVKGEEGTSVSLSIVNAKGKSHRCRHRIRAAIHGSGTINYHQSVFISSKILLRSPGSVNGICLLIAHAFVEEGLDDFIRGKRAGVQLSFSSGYLAQECLIAFTIVAIERFAVLEHGLGGLLGIVKGIVLHAEAILNDANTLAEFYQGLTILSIIHTEVAGNPLGTQDSLGIGCINGRQPLCQQADIVSHIHSVQICLQLLLDYKQSVLLTGSTHKAQQIVPTTVLCNVGNVLLGRSRLVLCKPLQAHTEHLSLAKATAYIAGKEKSLHCQVGIFSEGPDKAPQDLLFARASQCADSREQIQAIRIGCCMRNSTILSIGAIHFIFQMF